MLAWSDGRRKDEAGGTMLQKGSSGGGLMRDRPGPLPSTFPSQLQTLGKAYLHNSDPAEQSGFYGGPERWRAEREPILEAISADGELLDTGCANGYLLECLVTWGRKRGVSLIPYGLDQGARLIELARRRQPHLADHWVIMHLLFFQHPAPLVNELLIIVLTVEIQIGFYYLHISLRLN